MNDRFSQHGAFTWCELQSTDVEGTVSLKAPVQDPLLPRCVPVSVFMPGGRWRLGQHYKLGNS
jgi:hypothetical protein